MKQFELRIAKRSGVPSEIASALWQKGVRIQAFSGEIREGQDIFHVAVDKAALAKQTFIENGWQAIEERPRHLHTLKALPSAQAVRVEKQQGNGRAEAELASKKT